MASPEFHALQEKMAAAPPPPPASSIAETRARIDAAMGNLPLAEGTVAVKVNANGVPCYLQQRAGADDDPLVVYFHGGGYRIASALAYRAFCSHLAFHAKVRVLNVHYRLAPENPFPAAVDDAVAAYRFALAQTSFRRIVLAGDSAGGGLTAAALYAAKRRGLPQPAGGVCLSPWADLTNSAATFQTRAEADKLFSLASATDAANLYLQGHDPKDPLASPALADLTGIARLLILVGDAEVLLDDAHNLGARARECGVTADVFVYPEMPHVWMTSYPAFPEAVQAVDQIANFIADVTK